MTISYTSSVFLNFFDISRIFYEFLKKIMDSIYFNLAMKGIIQRLSNLQSCKEKKTILKAF